MLVRLRTLCVVLGDCDCDRRCVTLCIRPAWAWYFQVKLPSSSPGHRARTQDVHQPWRWAAPLGLAHPLKGRVGNVWLTRSALLSKERTKIVTNARTPLHRSSQHKGMKKGKF